MPASDIKFFLLSFTMADGNDMVWVTWRKNKSRYDGKTHLVSKDLQVDPPTPLTVGTSVTIYWETGRIKYWTAEVAKSRTSLAKQKSSSKHEAAVGGDGIDIRGSNASMNAGTIQRAGKKLEMSNQPSTPAKKRRQRVPFLGADGCRASTDSIQEY